MNYKKPIYLILLILLVAALFGSSAFLQDSLAAFIDSLADFEASNPILAGFLFFVFASMAVLLGPFSSIPLVPPAVVIWGPEITFLLLLSGWLTGNTLAYFIGEQYGSFLVSKIVGEKELKGWVSTISKRVNFYILFLFRLATPSETGYVFGLLKYPFGKYFALTLMAEIPFAVIAVFASEEFATNGVRSLLNLGWLWAILIISSLLLLHYLKKQE